MKKVQLYPFIIDIEASSLSEDSYPIEIGWNDGNGNIDSFLINPDSVAGWTDWSSDSEKIHKISRDVLIEKGVDPQYICEKLESNFRNQTFYSDAPDWDLKWIDRLYSVSEYEAPSFKIVNFRRLNCIALFEAKKFRRVTMKIRHKFPKRHRAFNDVQFLLEVYKECWKKA